MPVPILMYHEVTERPLDAFRKYSITPAELAAQLEWLRHEGYAAVDLDDVYVAATGGRPLPARSVAITFDDGLRDCLAHAVPALASAGFTATFYIVAGLVGATTRWLPAERGIELASADWPALRAARAAGMHCQAHSLTHPRLAALSPQACREELTRARSVLEHGLGAAVRHMSYPFGSYDRATQDIAHEAGYVTATTVEQRLASGSDDLLALPRVPVLGGESLDDFATRIEGGVPSHARSSRLGRLLSRFDFRSRRGDAS